MTTLMEMFCGKNETIRISGKEINFRVKKTENKKEFSGFSLICGIWISSWFYNEMKNCGCLELIITLTLSLFIAFFIVLLIIAPLNHLIEYHCDRYAARLVGRDSVIMSLKCTDKIIKKYGIRLSVFRGCTHPAIGNRIKRLEKLKS